jgi:hypothetical protein
VLISGVIGGYTVVVASEATAKEGLVTTQIDSLRTMLDAPAGARVEIPVDVVGFGDGFGALFPDGIALVVLDGQDDSPGATVATGSGRLACSDVI